MTPQELTEHFHKVIPISKNLGIEVVELTEQHALIKAPLKPNLNHVQTAFGGSLYSAAALACYALFKSLSRNAGGTGDELVIQEGHIDYIAPIVGDFTVKATLIDPADAKKFETGVSRRGRARLRLKASIECNGRVGAIFEGVYVITDAKSDRSN